MKQRVISAVIASLILVPLILLGGIYLKVGLTILGILAIREILKIKEDLPIFIKVITYILTGVLIFFDINLMVKIFIVILILFSLLVFCEKDKYNIENCVYLSCFIIFISTIFNYFYIIRTNDITVLAYLFSITILTDTFAYIGGKLFGKNKLIEKISPNKTIEGSLIGTIIGTVIPSAFYIYMIDPGEYLIVAIAITFILSIMGQLGDLVFSSIKRYYNIKDFSNIMPGHGGVLDRLDSIIFVVIGYVILFNFI